MIEINISKFINTLFFNSIEIGLFDVVKSEKFEKIISAETFYSIEKIVLN